VIVASVPRKYRPTMPKLRIRMGRVAYYLSIAVTAFSNIYKPKTLNS